MLRTNDTFLNYVEELYEKQIRKEGIIKKKYAKGERILVQDEVASKVMFIKQGITKCYFTEDNAKEYIFEFLGQGEVIGDIEFVRHVPCLCTIEAMTDVLVYAFSTSYFQQVLDADLKMNSLLIKVFADRISHTATRAAYQQLYTIEHSLIKLLELQEKQKMAISKEEMASYLGISVRSLNRGLKNLDEYYQLSLKK